MAEFEKSAEAIVDVTRPAFEGIEDYTPRQVGEIGEALAAQYLSDRGFELIDTNVVTPFGEVDIVAKDEDEVVFVEVKSRRLLGYLGEVTPEVAFDEDKFARYKKMSEAFRMAGDPESMPRIDVVGITFLSDRMAHIAHFAACYSMDE